MKTRSLMVAGILLSFVGLAACGDGGGGGTAGAGGDSGGSSTSGGSGGMAGAGGSTTDSTTTTTSMACDMTLTCAKAISGIYDASQLCPGTPASKQYGDLAVCACGDGVTTGGKCVSYCLSKVSGSCRPLAPESGCGTCEMENCAAQLAACQ